MLKGNAIKLAGSSIEIRFLIIKQYQYSKLFGSWFSIRKYGIIRENSYVY